MIVCEGTNYIRVCEEVEKIIIQGCEEKSIQLEAFKSCGNCMLYSFELECMESGNYDYTILLGETIIEQGELYFD